VKNKPVADFLMEIANLLDLKGENQFRIKTYWSAARRIEGMTQDIEELWKADDLRSIPGVGEGLAEKIDQFLRTGTCVYYEDLKKDVPPGLLLMLKVPGLGPKRVRQIHDVLGVSSVEELEAACKSHKIAMLPRMGGTIEENIVREIQRMRERPERYLLGDILPYVGFFVDVLAVCPSVVQASVAGSIRRRKETIRDVDILCATDQPSDTLIYFAGRISDRIKEIVAHGDTKLSFITKENIQIDVRAVNPRSWGAALQYFTGSKNHNIHLRSLAMEKGYKISEYDIREVATDKVCGGAEEGDIYKVLGMQYVPPEFREDQGEIAAALMHSLPKVINLGDIKGDLHVHTTWSDGHNSIEEMAIAAHKRGYQYIGIADHTQGLGIANGMKPEKAIEQILYIDRLNASGTLPIRVYAGIECDIRADGSLDYPDEILEQFDYVIASVHSSLSQSKEIMTERIVKALESPHVDILAHPTGRMLGKRDGADFDLNRVFYVARANRVAVEINSAPDRLDLSDVNARSAQRAGVQLVVNTDAHNTEQLGWIDFGVDVARRAWLESRHVFNTLEDGEFHFFIMNH
jgi:DNA polymerase (family 10)